MWIWVRIHIGVTGVLYEPSESTDSEPTTDRTRSFPFFTVSHHVGLLGINKLLFSFSTVLELQHFEPESVSIESLIHACRRAT